MRPRWHYPRLRCRVGSTTRQLKDFPHSLGWTIWVGVVGVVLLGFLHLASAQTVSQRPPSPTLISPGNTNEPGPEIESQTVTFRWNPMPDATGYRVFIRDLTTDELKSVPVLPETEDLQVTLVPGSRYRWNMVASLGTNVSGVSDTFYFRMKQMPVKPRISEVSPFPVPAIDAKQMFTVYGYEILHGCKVALRHKESGQVWDDVKIVNRQYRFVSVLANFSSNPADWSVEVINPGGHSSGEFEFPVVSPIRIPAWRWWRSGWPWAWGGLILLGITGSCLWWTSRRRLPREIDRARQKTQREERDRLVRDLHDRASADIAYLAQLADDALAQSASFPSEVQTNVRELHSAARDAETALSDLVWAAEPQGERLPQLAARLLTRIRERLKPHAIEAKFDWPAPVPNFPINSAVSSQLLHLCHEVLNNVIKHARAAKLVSTLIIEEGQLVLSFRDDGRGFASDSQQAGRRGLANMRSRALMLGGSLEIQSGPGQGTSITILLPLDRDGNDTP